MIITTSETVKILKDYHDSIVDGIGSYDIKSSFEGLIEIPRIIINDKLDLKSPVFTYSKLVRDKDFSTFKKEYYIVIGQFVVVTFTEEDHDRLFNRIAAVLSFGDKAVGDIEELFKW